MPRTRKAQSGAPRVGTGRVASTTTYNSQIVYRIPAMNNRKCENPLGDFEITGTSPIIVHLEGTNVYNIRLDWNALKNTIQTAGLDLSQATIKLGTVNGNVEFAGNITADGTFTGTTVNATNIDATSIEGDSVTSATITATALIADSATIEDLTATNATVEGELMAEGGLTVNNGLTVESGDTSVANLGVTGTATIVDADITTADVTTLNVSGAATFTGTASLNGITNLTVTGTTTLNNLEVNGSATIDGQLNAGTVRSDDIVSDEIRATEGLYLSAGAEAPQLVMQSEKNQANGVAGLDVNGKINSSVLPAGLALSFYYETSTQGSTTYQLQHTPVSDSAIMVFTDSGTALFPTIDYTCVNGYITFTAMGEEESAIIWVVTNASN